MCSNKEQVQCLGKYQAERKSLLQTNNGEKPINIYGSEQTIYPREASNKLILSIQ
jgi:hypothetical protein